MAWPFKQRIMKQRSRLRFGVSMPLLLLLLAACETEAQNSAESYQELHLEARSAFETAIIAHPAVQRSLAQVDAAKAGIRQTQAARNPQLAAGLDLGASHDTVTATTAPVVSAVVSVSQLLEDGGLVSAQLDQAHRNVVAARVNLLLTVDELVTQLVSLEIDRRLAAGSMRAIRRILAEYEERAGQIELAARQGALTNLDVAAIDTALNQLETRHLDARLALETATMTIETLLTGAATDAAELQLQRLIGQFDRFSPRGKPNYRAFLLENGLLILDAQSEQIAAAGKPQVRLNANLSSPVQAATTFGVRGFVGVQVNLSLFDGGARAAQIDALSAQRDAETHSIDTVFEGVEIADRQLHALKSAAPRKAQLLRARAALSRERLGEVEQLLRAGRASIADVAEEVLAGAEAELELVALEAQLARALLASFSARGATCDLVSVCSLFDPGDMM